MNDDKMENCNSRDNYLLFEDIVCEVFKKSGYSVSTGRRFDNYLWDCIAETEEEKYFIEVKFLVGHRGDMPGQVREKITRLTTLAKGEGRVVLVVAGTVDEALKRNYLEKNDIILLDLSNLLWVTQGHADIRNRLLAIIPYSVDEVEYVKPQIQLGWIEHEDNIKTLIQRLNSCTSGRNEAIEYEKICVDILKELFVDDISLWEPQKMSNGGLYRFDLICRIKLDKKSPFWYIVEHGFNSYYVVFEFKNYTKKISQKEIYTTEKYLYAKSLRNVAIMLTTQGADENAKCAVKGCLRESGKLIIVLNREDIETMLRMKADEEDPSEHLLAILDNMLEELEK